MPAARQRDALPTSCVSLTPTGRRRAAPSCVAEVGSEWSRILAPLTATDKAVAPPRCQG